MKKPTGIAIIGMGCIFPESCNLKAYWRLLFNGIDAIQPVPGDTHWRLADYFHEDPSFPDHTYCTRGGFIPKTSFDPLSYGIPPNNLEATDTSQLLGLEVARMALEDAGYPKDHAYLEEKTVNVILGVTGTQELVIPLGARLGHPIWRKALSDAGVDADRQDAVVRHIDTAYARWQENSFPGLLGNVVAGRIANRFDLSGTNAVSDAACASSLSAIHSAMMELNAHRCDMSITGGVDTLNDIFMHMCFSKTGVLSHTSDARPFSEKADGTVLGEGIGMLVLKRLADAERDGDRIYAVIKGMGTASDGRTSAIYAPESAGQLKALKQAYQEADIDPATVGMVEAHGTGTRVGDKVEFTALKACFESSKTRNSTAVGSVKSMIGHTKAAAGAAGIIKTALALHHKVIPPTLKAETPDPELDINNSAFYLNNRSKPWIPRAGTPRRSGISAFGFGGSNFHAVLEEYDGRKTHVSWDGSVQIAAFSAAGADDLIRGIESFFSDALAGPDLDGGERTRLIAWLAQESRKRFSHTDAYRLLMVLTGETDLPALKEIAVTAVRERKPSQGIVCFETGKAAGKLGFLFPGQGSQYTGMAKDLMSVFPEAIDAVRLATDAFSDAFSTGADAPESLGDYMFPLPAHVRPAAEAEAALRRTNVAQPAIGAVSMAMTAILNRFGIRPDCTCGHSFGELAALHAAGWLDDRTLANLAAVRGKYMAAAGNTGSDSGSMMAVKAPLPDIEAMIRDENLDLVLANRNSPEQGVVSGPTREIDRARAICRKKKMRAMKLPVAAAFHSPLVEKAAQPFSEFLAGCRITPTKTDVLSNTTGEVYGTAAEDIIRSLGRQLMHPVNFVRNIRAMRENGVSCFIEVGPKAVLTGLVKQILKGEPVSVASLDSSGGKGSGLEDLAKTICLTAAKGFHVDLTQWEDPVSRPAPKRMRVLLSGANPRPAPAKQPKNNDRTVKKAAEAEQPRPVSGQPGPAKPIENHPSPAAGRTSRKGYDMSSNSRTVPAAPAGDAVQLIRQGLEAMQQLQAQTARAHEKFLETQTQASKTLAGMMEQTRQFIASPGIQQPTAADMPVPREIPLAPVSDPVPAPAPAEPPVPTPVAQAEPAVAAQVHPVAETAAPPVAAAPVSPQPAAPEKAVPAAVVPPIQTILFDTVSQLTGFPVEMLEPDMDIESDLGIDSIKKVEIVSELEKQLPDNKGLTTENIGAVRTLQDICDAIQAEMPATTQVREEPPPVSEAPAPSAKASHPLLTLLKETISELTGFPVEMLEPDMNLESDLGIDSIKRVEILSRLEQELPDGGSLSSEDMAGLTTLQDIVDFIGTPAETEPAKKKTSHGEQHGDEPRDRRGDRHGDNPDQPVADPDTTELLRQEVILKEYPTNQIRFYNGARIELARDKRVYITRDTAGICDAFKREFENQHISAQVIDMSDTPDLPDAAGIVIVQDRLEGSDVDHAARFLKQAFSLARQNADHLMAAGSESGAFLATVSFLGGSFGFNGKPEQPVYGGLAGLAKTANLEWKSVLCRALDLPGNQAASVDNAEAAVALMMTQGEVEMGLDGDACNIPVLKSVPVQDGRIVLDSSDVVAITGGAKGVTAACAIQLAAACAPKIVLIGRSPHPFQEPEWAAGISDAAALKKEILAREFPDQKPTPSELEKRYHAIRGNREILETMATIRHHGSEVTYVSADIRDAGDLQARLTDIRSRWGRFSAVIHGAGVLEDKLIKDKDPQLFSRVFDTKVQGLTSLLTTCENDPLKYIVLFSSVAARSGNTGQCDYAMANEALNKTAQQLAAEKPDCRIISINWGPWDGGMVNESLKKTFTQRGIHLIPLKAGARQMIKEMAASSGPVEMVIGAQLTSDKPVKKSIMSTVMHQAVGMETVPVLAAHQINREPVMPFALLVEMMAHAAEKNNPGLVFSGMDDVRVLKGVRPGAGQMGLMVNLGKCTPAEAGFIAPAAITSGDAATHAGGRMILKNRLPKPPVLSKAAFMALKPSRLTIERAYDDILFHGKALQSITAINGVSEKGIEVMTGLAPSPDQWFTNPSQRAWVTEPMMLDAAFQAAILWTWETKGQVCLPSYMANFRLYSSIRSIRGDQIRVLFTVNEDRPHRIKGYFTFLDADGTVVASITGFEAVVDPALHDKFKPAPLFDREAILAFAQGNPSDAFGDRYRIFDSEREIARLPRPPYFFMDRVLSADHPQWEMVSGGWIETEYDVPADAWYFDANRTDTMPFCILLEIALQPCGWLAAYAGSALKSQDRLHFRNLGGNARLLHQITRRSGTLTVRCRMTDVSQAGGMIIQDFEMQVLNQGQVVYQGTTNFGFFTAEALSNQVGIRASQLTGSENADAKPVLFTPDAPLTPDDKDRSPHSGMPAKALRMIDTIDLLDPSGGHHGQGYIKAGKQVDPGEWFFDAHFYQDPVCPGSLGVESFLQMIRYFLMETSDIDPERFTPRLSTDHSHEWIYRGQIIPTNRHIEIHAHIRQVSSENDAYSVMADGALTVDGICIYEMKGFGVEFVDTVSTRGCEDMDETSSGRR